MSLTESFGVFKKTKSHFGVPVRKHTPFYKALQVIKIDVHLDLEPTQVEGKKRIALNFNDLQAINELRSGDLVIACGNGLHMLDRKGTSMFK